MTDDAYKQSKDFKCEGVIPIHKKPDAGVFDKTSRSKMIFSLSAGKVGESMAEYIKSHKHLVNQASPNTYDSYLEVFKRTKRSEDIINGKYKKKFSSINSLKYPQIVELLNSIKQLTYWRRQS